MVTEVTVETLKNSIRNIPDFPKPGIQFKDITPLLKDPELFGFAVDALVEGYASKGITKIVCIESRGFILGGAMAARLNAGFVPVRKPGKLPAPTVTKHYQLEYGTDSVEVHRDAIGKEDVLLLHDDLLATGGTAAAVISLLNMFTPRRIYMSFLVELDFLQGRSRLTGYDINSLIHF